MAVTMTDLRNALGLGDDAGREELVREARRLTAAASTNAVSGLARADLETVVALEQQFGSAEADGVDAASAIVHDDAMRALAADGIDRPTEGEYAAAVDQRFRALGWNATTNPLPAVRQSPPLLETDARPNVHHDALSILHSSGGHETGDGLVTQEAYDAAVAEVLRRSGL